MRKKKDLEAEVERLSVECESWRAEVENCAEKLLSANKEAKRLAKLKEPEPQPLIETLLAMDPTPEMFGKPEPIREALWAIRKGIDVLRRAVELDERRKSRGR